MEVAQHWRVKAQRFNLRGTVCENCKSVHFPPRAVCPNCAADMATGQHEAQVARVNIPAHA